MERLLDPVLLIPMVVLLVVIFFFLGWVLNNRIGRKSIASSEERAKQIINDAQKEAANLKREKLLEVKDEWYKKKIDFDNEISVKKNKLSNLEKQLTTREENIEKKFELVLKKERENKNFEREVVTLKNSVQTKLTEIQRLEVEQNERLEKISGLTADEAKKMLIENMTNEAKTEVAHLIKDMHDSAKLEAKKDAQKLIVLAIQRTAADHAVETTVSVVQIQNDEMKGRIIGKEG
ncbi:MAG TPA: Rnase Y domain-containing protein, partial [Ignavibacteriaceae bacterium]|nr:Rnase Y domain-containing protein [Ignavibacteriaceae bacterium]